MATPNSKEQEIQEQPALGSDKAPTAQDAASSDKPKMPVDSMKSTEPAISTNPSSSAPRAAAIVAAQEKTDTAPALDDSSDAYHVDSGEESEVDSAMVSAKSIEGTIEEAKEDMEKVVDELTQRLGGVVFHLKSGCLRVAAVFMSKKAKSDLKNAREQREACVAALKALKAPLADIDANMRLWRKKGGSRLRSRRGSESADDADDELDDEEDEEEEGSKLSPTRMAMVEMQYQMQFRMKTTATEVTEELNALMHKPVPIQKVERFMANLTNLEERLKQVRDDLKKVVDAVEPTRPGERK